MADLPTSPPSPPSTPPLSALPPVASVLDDIVVRNIIFISVSGTLLLLVVLALCYCCIQDYRKNRKMNTSGSSNAFTDLLGALASAFAAPASMHKAKPNDDQLPIMTLKVGPST